MHASLLHKQRFPKGNSAGLTKRMTGTYIALAVYGFLAVVCRHSRYEHTKK